MKTLFDLIPDKNQSQLDEKVFRLSTAIESLISPSKDACVIREIDKAKPWIQLNQNEYETYLLVSNFGYPNFYYVEPVVCDLKSGAWQWRVDKWTPVLSKRRVENCPFEEKTVNELGDINAVPRWYFSFTEKAKVSKRSLLSLEGRIKFERERDSLLVSGYDAGFTSSFDNPEFHEWQDFDIEAKYLKRMMNYFDENELYVCSHKSSLHENNFYYYFTNGYKFVGGCSK